VRHRLTLLSLLVLSACVSRPVIPILNRNVIASGTLEHHALTNDLFRIDDFWMRVPPDTEFHRWLSQGVDRRVSITLSTTPERFADKPTTRILTGTLIHNTAIDAMIVTHILYVQDPATRALSPITFETVDQHTAAKWDDYDNGELSVVIKVG
jgi:hypothetical protein